ncbi:hypothetical protein ACWKWP_15620 [Agromyces soli]
MSTIDPAAARRERLERQQGSLGAALAAAFSGLLLVATGAMTAYGFAAFLDQFRIMSLNSVFSTWDSQMGSPFPWLPIGIVGSIVAWALYVRWNHRYSGTTARFVGPGPLSVLLIGLVGGLWFGCLSWTAPDEVGTAVDPTLGEDEPWDAGAWIFYTAQWWLPIGFTVLALAAFTAGMLGRRARTARGELLDRLLISGRRAEGVVTESTTPSGEASWNIFSLTVKFTDLTATDRWVTRAVKYRSAEVPPVGAPMTVLYDPSAPGDESRIFLASGPATTADDFRRNEL